LEGLNGRKGVGKQDVEGGSRQIIGVK